MRRGESCIAELIGVNRDLVRSCFEQETALGWRNTQRSPLDSDRGEVDFRYSDLEAAAFILLAEALAVRE